MTKTLDEFNKLVDEMHDALRKMDITNSSYALSGEDFSLLVTGIREVQLHAVTQAFGSTRNEYLKERGDEFKALLELAILGKDDAELSLVVEPEEPQKREFIGQQL